MTQSIFFSPITGEAVVSEPRIVIATVWVREARLSSSFQIEPIHSTFEDNFLRLSVVNVDLLSIFLDDGD